MFLTNQDIIDLVAWRRTLHVNPELSGEEVGTAREVAAIMSTLQPDHVLTGLGGHGVAAIFEGREAGPTVLLRAELDGLPIEEISDAPHRSKVAGKGHLCGHDGHMATLAAVARGLSRQRPVHGRVVLLFQPAEENGAGAAAVIADAKFPSIAPDYAFSMHNMPGLKFGAVALAAGPVNCASRGMRCVLMGKTAHASMPETGLSPMTAVARLMPDLTALGRGLPMDTGFSLVTVTHARMGAPAFGVAPGEAEIWATLRTLTDDGMASLQNAAESLVMSVAAEAKLDASIQYEDVFAHCENAPEAVALLRRALDAEALAHDDSHLPMRGSEDFGRFGKVAPAAMFFLGAGESHPSLRNPDYDFPDDLISIGARVFMRVVRDLLG